MLSVITTLIHIVPHDVTHLQYVVSLDPSSWLYNAQCTVNDVYEKITQLIEVSNANFKFYRDDFFGERLQKVIESQEHGRDIVDLLTDDVEHDIMPGATTVDPYAFLPHGHPNDPPSVTVGDPCMKIRVHTMQFKPYLSIYPK